MLEYNILLHLISDGDDGMDAGKCSNRAESAPLNDNTKSLVLMNYFPSVPVKLTACLQHSQSLIDMVNTCYSAAGNRWANFIAVDYYKVLSIWKSDLLIRTFRNLKEDQHLTLFETYETFSLVVFRSTVQHFQIFYRMRLTLFWTEIFQRSDGGGVFQATDLLNGRLLCGCQDIKACSVRQRCTDFFSYVDECVLFFWWYTNR